MSFQGRHDEVVCTVLLEVLHLVTKYGGGLGGGGGEAYDREILHLGMQGVSFLGETTYLVYQIYVNRGFAPGRPRRFVEGGYDTCDQGGFAPG